MNKLQMEAAIQAIKSEAKMYGATAKQIDELIAQIKARHTEADKLNSENAGIIPE